MPKNIIDSGISFTFTNSTEKRKLRKEAAFAIQTLVRPFDSEIIKKPFGGFDK